MALDSNGDRIESYEVMNYIPGEGDMLSSVAVGMFDSINRLYRAYGRAVLWPGKMMEVPVDYFSGATSTSLILANYLILWLQLSKSQSGRCSHLSHRAAFTACTTCCGVWPLCLKRT